MAVESDGCRRMPEPSEQAWMAIQTELFAGRKIQAIKLYRQASGLGLKEAKDAMEAYEVKLREQAPDRFTSTAKSGCAGMIVLALLLTGIGGYCWRARLTFISSGLSVEDAPLMMSYPNATGAHTSHARSPHSQGFRPDLICPR